MVEVVKIVIKSTAEKGPPTTDIGFVEIVCAAPANSVAKPAERVRAVPYNGNAAAISFFPTAVNLEPFSINAVASSLALLVLFKTSASIELPFIYSPASASACAAYFFKPYALYICACEDLKLKSTSFS